MEVKQNGGQEMDVRCSDEQTDMKWNKLMDNNSKHTDPIQLNHTNNKLAQEIRLASTKNKTYKISRNKSEVLISRNTQVFQTLLDFSFM